MITENKSPVQAIVADDLKAWLKARARAEGRSLSNLVAVLLEEARQEKQPISQKTDRERRGS